MTLLHSKRLTLSSQLTETDLGCVVGWLGDPEVVKYSEQRHKKHTIESQYKYLMEFDPRDFYLGIHKEWKIIGTISAVIDRPNGVANVGMMIGERSLWGKGYGLEAWSCLCDYLFRNDIRKIEAGCMHINSGMMKVCKRYGMDQEGRKPRQIAEIRMGMRDPDAANRLSLDELKRQLAGSEAELLEFGNVLVPPDKMPELLRSLLMKHRGLELLSLQTLSPTPLIERPVRKPEVGKDTGFPPEKINLYKHGIEIKVAGSYPDPLAFLSELEKSPQRFLWGEMALSVTKHPRSELTLTVHTLSLEKTWLTV